VVEENSATVVSYSATRRKACSSRVRREHVSEDVEVCLHLCCSIHGIERYL